MPIRVLFFGATAEVTGERSIEVDVDGGQPATRVFRQVLDKYPSLNSHRLLFAINQQYASGDEIVGENDELAVFTAVSGG